MSEQHTGHPDALVGRRREFDEAIAVVNAALAGDGGPLLVTGEAGVGKSRLVAGLVASTSARCLWGFCWDERSTPPFWPWTMVLRACQRVSSMPLSDDLGVLLGAGVPRHASELPGPSEQLRLRMLESVASYLGDAAGREPLLIVLEDIHVADEASLELLRFLAASTYGLPIAIVATHRYPDLVPGAPLEPALAELGRRARTITLYGLGGDGVGELVELQTGVAPSATLVSRVHERTGGNPLFVIELARLLAAQGDRHLDTMPIPPSVQQVISQRLGYLARPTRDVLTVASVVGEVFDHRLLAELVDDHPDRLADLLDEAIAAGLIMADGSIGRYRFAHVLVRDVLYAGLTGANRRASHLRVARALAAMHVTELDDHLDALADHHLAALPDAALGNAVDACRRAGRRATRMLAYDQAARRYSQAADLTASDHVDAAERSEILLALGDAQLRAGDWHAASSTFDTVAASARRRQRPGELARAALGLGAGLSGFEVRLFDQGQLDLLREALAALDHDEVALRAWVLARLSVAESYVAADTDRLAHSAEAVELARRRGDGKLLAYALSSHCDAMPAPEHVEQRLAIASEMVQLGIDNAMPRVSCSGAVSASSHSSSWVT